MRFIAYNLKKNLNNVFNWWTK